MQNMKHINYNINPLSVSYALLHPTEKGDNSYAQLLGEGMRKEECGGAAEDGTFDVPVIAAPPYRKIDE